MTAADPREEWAEDFDRWIEQVKAEARAEVGTKFAEWAAKNEIAEAPLDWAWFGEIVRWTGSPAYESEVPNGGE